MINSEHCFEIWAPDGVTWSEWAKPVVFSTKDGTLPSDPPAPASPVVFPRNVDGRRDAALVVDLAGSEAVEAGLALADRGYRPVPLFNGTQGPTPLIDLAPLIAALGAGPARLNG